MEREKMEQLIKKYLKKLKQLLPAIENDFDQEAIHQFRVQVKRLRALIRLVAATLDDADELKLPEKLRKLYLAAGSLRDLQLHTVNVSNAFKQRSLPVGYIQLLEDETTHCKRKLQLKLEQDSLTKAESGIIDNLPVAISGEQIREFVRQKTAIINIFLSTKQQTDDDMHTLRKNVKDLLYVVKMFKEDEKQSAEVLFFPDSEISKAENIADDLGQFVDKYIGVDFLKPSWLNEVNAVERNQLRALRLQWQAEMITIKERMNHNSASLLFQTMLL